MNIIFHVLIAIVLILIVGLFYTALHEDVHQAIFTMYGCESELVWFYDGSIAATLGSPDCENTESMLNAHAINEVVGYTMIPVVFLLTGILFFKVIEYLEK